VRPVGIVVNPQSGKDLRRLTSAAGQVSDGVKVDTVRQLILGALEAGVERVLLPSDRSSIGTRAARGLDARVRLFEGPSTGSRLDTIDAAKQLAKDEAIVVGLGGDGTARDLATGWPGLPLIALSTGTNNVFPSVLNPTAAGLAAGHLATGRVLLEPVATEAKRIVLTEADEEGGREEDMREEGALVDVALIDANAVGARAVTDPATVRWVLACIAEPTTTGLSSIAAQVADLPRTAAGGVLVELGAGGTPVRAALSPGVFSTVEVAAVHPIAEGETVPLPGRGILAFDGERHMALKPGTLARIDRQGPLTIDVGATLRTVVTEEHR